ncbi:MAG: NADH-quinone oxidoreductase subunit C [Actinomycetota bacterium]
MTISRSEASNVASAGTLHDLADSVAIAVGGEAVVAFGTAKIRVSPDDWVSALTVARDQFGLHFFSWLSAVDWSNKVEVGDPLTAEVEERFEVLAAVGDTTVGHLLVFSTDLPKDRASIQSLVGVYSGANWHEREAHEMFGIDFAGHPHLVKLYLPDGFQGHPLRKSFPLLTREVKPWPGIVDVEGMPGRDDDEGQPSEENPEA